MDNQLVLADIKLGRVMGSGLCEIPDRHVNCRLAYLSGYYLALVVILSWEVVDRPFLTEDFWLVLEDFDALTANELISFISFRSLEKINLIPEMVPNPKLLIGVTRKYYIKGYRDCAEIVFESIRGLFVTNFDKNYSHHFQEYLGEKLNEVAKEMNF